MTDVVSSSPLGGPRRVGLRPGRPAVHRIGVRVVDRIGLRVSGLPPGLIGNPEVLAVHQDRLGRQARRVRTDGSVETWRKDLADGSSAVGIFNRGDRPVVAGVDWAEIGLRGPVVARDLWQHRAVDAPAGWQAALPSHASAMLLVSPLTLAGDDPIHA